MILWIVISIVFFLLIIYFVTTLTEIEKDKSELNDKVNKSDGITEIIDVKVISRRTESRGQYTYTRYFVTFENIKNGERTEVDFYGEVFAMIAEGDKGQLIYKDNNVFFKRDREQNEKLEIVGADVEIMDKRTKNDGGVTRYFVTFENIDNGECTEMEFPIEQFILMAVGDKGKFANINNKVSFEREIHTSKKIDLVKR